MISVYIKSNEIFIAQGSSKSSKLKVKAQLHAENLEDVNATAIELINKLSLKKEKLRFVVDSVAAVTTDKPMHCVPERKLTAAINNNSVRKAKTVNNQLDTMLESIEEHENRQMQTTAHITAIPSELAFTVQEIVKAVGMPIDNMIIGNIAEAKTVAALDNIPYKNIAVITYKKDFATVSAFTDNKLIRSYNIAFSSADDSLALERLIEIAHTIVRECKEQNDIIIEAIYVAGKINDKYNTLERLADDIGLDCLEFVSPKSFKGISSEELNEFLPAFGGLLD